MSRLINQGQVVGIMQDEQFNEEVLIVRNEEETVYILNQEAGISNAINFMGLQVDYIHTQDIDGKQYASIIQLELQALSALIDAFDKNPTAEYLAEVVMVESSVARVKINHYIANLHRQDLTPDPVILSEVLKVGEILPVRIKSIRKEYIQVVAINQRMGVGCFDITDLKENDLVYGVVDRTKMIRKVNEDKSLEKSIHTFVTIARGMDALAPEQIHRPVEAGNQVVFKINQINKDGRIRGKILRILTTKKEPKQIPVTDNIQMGDVLVGKVKLVRYDYQLGEKVLIMIIQNQQIIIPFSQLSSQDLSMQEISWVGYSIQVKVIEIGSRILASKQQQDKDNRQVFINEWKSNPEEIKYAYIKEIGSIGYILNIGREEVFLLKSDYHSILGTVEEVELSDKIYVQLKSVQDDIINVIPATNHRQRELEILGITEDEFQPMRRGLLPIYQGVISKLMKKGAYLTINGVRVFLPNSLFSLETTRVMDIYQIGDVIPVRMHTYNKKHIVVCSNPRYVRNNGLTFEELKPGMLAYGLVRKIYQSEVGDDNEFGQKVFTSIGLKLEGLSPESPYFEIEEGDKVIYRVNQVRPDGSIRGKIVRLLEI